MRSRCISKAKASKRRLHSDGKCSLKRKPRDSYPGALYIRYHPDMLADKQIILITNGRVIDPASGRDEIADVLISDGIIQEINSSIERPTDVTQIIDATDCLVTPGLIDLHVHFREPGQSHKETIVTGCASAVAGGFTTVCCMPNTDPAIDSSAVIKWIDEKAREADLARVFVVAAATLNRQGNRVGALQTLSNHSAVAFSDDGDCIMNASVMQDVLQACAEAGRPFMQHCQDHHLAGKDASMNDGEVSARLGLIGWPRLAEEIIIERDIRLNSDIGAKYHVQHVSSGGSIDIVRAAQKAGQPITCEASPHHLLLTDEACLGFNTLAKMNPPLREQHDIDALKRGISDGTITILATDHAPHTSDDKDEPFEDAAFGIIGVECALPLYVKALIDDGTIDWPRLIALMTIEPARLIGLDAQGIGLLQLGGPGDVTVIDPNVKWTIDVNDFKSKSRNCPFDGWDVTGRAIATIVAGSVKFLMSHVA